MGKDLVACFRPVFSKVVLWDAVRCDKKQGSRSGCEYLCFAVGELGPDPGSISLSPSPSLCMALAKELPTSLNFTQQQNGHSNTYLTG